MIAKIRKRDGRYVKFNEEKIIQAIQKAILAVEAEVTINRINKITQEIIKKVEEQTPEGRVPTVEEVQDVVETVLMTSKLPEVAKAYILYREDRNRIRDRETKLMKTFKEIETDKKTASNFLASKRDYLYENPSKSIIDYGREGAKEYNKMFIVNPDYVKLHENGDIYIKEIEYYNSSLNTLQLDLEKLFDSDLKEGHYGLEKPNSIDEYVLYIAFIISRIEKDLYGGVSIPNFDFVIAKAVRKNYHLIFIDVLTKITNLLNVNFDIDHLVNKLEANKFKLNDHKYDELLIEQNISKELIDKIYLETEKELVNKLQKALNELLTIIELLPTKTNQGVANISIAYGTDISVEGRLVTKTILEATQRGRNQQHLSTTPVQIFKIKNGINAERRDPNFDLFELAIKTTAKRLYPNFMFLDSTPNIINNYNNEKNVSYTATRNRIITNLVEYNETPLGRGSVAETIVNLPRIALSSKGIDDFYNKLDNVLTQVINQLVERYRSISNLRVSHLPFIMGNKAWIDSGSLNKNDSIAQVIKNGSLDIGFVGLAEALTALTGAHHAQNETSRLLGLEIIEKINLKINTVKEKYYLNFQLVASSKVDVFDNFVIKDQNKFGIIKGVTDKSYYTDSFHVPSDYPINAEDKINIESPYHSLIPGGHITYIELGGIEDNKVDSIKKIIKVMKSKNIGYGAINHDLDFDPVCGYYGVVETSECPNCHRIENQDQPFLKYRRINDLLIKPINNLSYEVEEVALRVKNINNLIRVSGFVNDSIVDGPGMRFVIFTQGCLIGCPGCHNPETWDVDGGTLMEVDDIVAMWRQNPLIEGITLSGGDPLLQPDKALYLVKKAKETNLSVVVYSGKYYHELLAENNPYIIEILTLADILIDGPFEMDKLNLDLAYRGSENQRIIDLVKTREHRQIIKYQV